MNNLMRSLGRFGGLGMTILSIVFLFFILAPSVVVAENGAPPPTEAEKAKAGAAGALDFFKTFTAPAAGFGEKAAQEPEVVIGRIIQGALVIIGTIFGVLMVYAGYLWMQARGNEEYVKKAKGILEAAIIGIILVMAAYAITAFIVSRIIGAAQFGV